MTASDMHLNGPRLEALAAGETPESAERVHLEVCAVCRAGIESLRAENGIFSAELAVNSTQENVMTAASNIARMPAQSHKPLALYAAAASIMIVAALGLIALRHQPNNPAPIQPVEPVELASGQPATGKHGQEENFKGDEKKNDPPHNPPHEEEALYEGKSVSQWLDFIKDPKTDPDKAVHALVAIGREGLPQIIAELRKSEKPDESRLVSALMGIEVAREDIRQFADFLKDPNYVVRKLGVRLLVNVAQNQGVLVEDVRRALQPALKDRDKAVVEAARDAIGPNESSSDIVVPPEILRQAELGDHFETINPKAPDRPDENSEKTVVVSEMSPKAPAGEVAQKSSNFARQAAELEAKGDRIGAAEAYARAADATDNNQLAQQYSMKAYQLRKFNAIDGARAATLKSEAARAGAIKNLSDSIAALQTTIAQRRDALNATQMADPKSDIAVKLKDEIKALEIQQEKNLNDLKKLQPDAPIPFTPKTPSVGESNLGGQETHVDAGLAGSGAWQDERWPDAIPCTCRMTSDKDGSKVVVAQSEGGTNDKFAFTRTGALNLKDAKEIVIHVFQANAAPLNIAVGFINAQNEYLETKQFKIPGNTWTTLSVKLDDKQYKSAKNGWKHVDSFDNRENTQRIVISVYERRPVKVLIDSIRLQPDAPIPAGPGARKSNGVGEGNVDD